jgi:quinone-modifying oxidoreductase subunit QmoC
MEQQTLIEAEQRNDLLEQVAALPEGERVLSCLQCGTCSATCPVAPMLEHSPRQIFAMMRAGMRTEVLSSLTPWMCSSCYECTVNCPAQIKITEIMYALKRTAIREGVTTGKCDVHRFYRLFTRIVCRFGRIHELLLLLKYMALRHPLGMLAQSLVGLRMMTTGTMKIQPHKLRNQESFEKMVEHALAYEE